MLLMGLSVSAVAEHYQAIHKGKILFYDIVSEERSEMAVTFRGATWDAVPDEYSETIFVPDQVERMGKRYTVVAVNDDAFRGCKGLKKVVLPSCVKTVGKRAFKDCEIMTEVVLPVRLDTLREETLDGCRHLSYLQLPDSLTHVAAYSLRGCVYLTRLYLPKTLTYFHPNSVDDCSSLIEISVDTLNGSYSSAEGLLYNKQGSALVRCPEGKTEVTLPKDLQGMGEYSMRGCAQLTQLLLPRVFYVGNNALEGCARLKRLSVPSSLNYISEGMASGCVSLDSVLLSKSTVSIRDGAFENCSHLRFIETPAVAEIGDRAFKNCSELSEFRFSTSLKSIGNEAFSGCVNLLSLQATTNTPAACGEGVFDPRITYKASLKVPEGALLEYRKAAGWQAIYNIK